METRFIKAVGLGVLLCLPVLAGAASKKSDQRIPLRYPLGLTPSTTPEYAITLLESKGLKRLSEKNVAGTHFVYWQLSGQIVYQNFAPTVAIVTFDRGKLSSVSLGAESISGCETAQAIYLSALNLLRDNYQIKKGFEFTQEPASDTLDCGPHFASDTYELQLTTKDFVAAVRPSVASGRYGVTLTYQWAGLLKALKEEQEKKITHVTPKNL